MTAIVAAHGTSRRTFFPFGTFSPSEARGRPGLFAYIGFDVVATTAEESVNPQRDLPIGILGSLAICTVLYMAVALVITGMVPYDQIDPGGALATAFEQVGQGAIATVIAADDGGRSDHRRHDPAHRLHPSDLRDEPGPPHTALARRHQRPHRHPVRATFIIGALVAADRLAHARRAARGDGQHRDAVGFVPVSLAVPVLRRRRPDLQRGFRVPFSPVLPYLSAALCIYLILNLSVETWIRFIVWVALGIVISFVYSRRHSLLAHGQEADVGRRPQVLDVD